MSTNQKRSTRTPSNTKRRDGDPVRVNADGRISYWTGGRPGEGTRVQERCRTLAKAETRAKEVRAALAKTHGLGPRDHGTLDEAFQDFIVHLRASNSPTGTVTQYKSNWNCWIPDAVGQTPCLKVNPSHLARILDEAVKDGASPSTIKNIVRTLGSFTKWAVAKDYFVSDEPFWG